MGVALAGSLKEAEAREKVYIYKKTDTHVTKTQDMKPANKIEISTYALRLY